MVMFTFLTLVGLYFFVGELNATRYQAAREQNATLALGEAKQALIGDSIRRTSISDAGYLRLPDLGSAFGVPVEGQGSGTFAGDGQDLSVIGKFPWKSLGTEPLRDQSKECLWYLVSGRFKDDTPALKTDTLNWDTLGQIDVIDGAGNLIATDLAALIIAPGGALGAQDRSLADVAYAQCGGNYNARNYLDAYDSANAVAGEVNYFSGSTNNRVAVTSTNKRFVVADTDHFNDRFLYITVDNLFNPLIKRSDFSAAITLLMIDTQFETMPVSGGKGTANLVCVTAFCKNWREMFFLTQLATPASITIDGAPSPICSRVLLFGGSKVTGQSRGSAVQIANKTNYLENTNASSFNAPTTISSDFNGTSVFDWHNPGADLVKCLP